MSEAKKLTFGSLFAGIGGFDLGLTRAGFTGIYAAEMDAKCNSVRRRHWPDETQYTDVAFVGRGQRPDVLCAGWPCQGNSVAGKRAGMADSRSGLWGEVTRILDVQRPCWFLGENVPGILSVNGGEDWATVLADLGRLGYGFAYRILDAQWFGVPQRRRRVFVVGCLGDWRRAAEILLESESLPWDSPPSREPGKRVAYCVAAGAGGSKFGSGRDGQDTFVTHTLTGEGFDASEDGTGRGTPIIPFDTGQVTSKQNRSRCEPGDPCHTLPAQGHVPSIAYAIQERAVSENPNAGPQGKGYAAETAYTLESRHHQQSVAYQCHGSNVGPMGTLRAGNGNETGGVPFTTNRFGVRRLMPIECERLQGFPDDWTRFGADGEEITDSARYRMCGNAVAVPCIEWIARRLIEAA